MKFTLTLPPPLNKTYGVSNRLGKAKFYKRAEVRIWEALAGWEIRRQGWSNKKPLEGNLVLNLGMFLARERDIDSSIKVILDLLQNMRVYRNDKQIMKLIVEKKKDIKNPRLEVEIEML